MSTSNMAVGRPPRPAPQPIQDYGCPIKGRDQLYYDRYAFAKRLSVDYGCATRPKLFRQISDRIFPGHFEWHHWTHRVIDTLCQNQWIGVVGCAGSAKTCNIASFACAWWLCDPAQSRVVFCSTTVKSLRARGWAEVQRCYTLIPGNRIGNFVDSQLQWQVTKGDSKHAIIGQAVEEGSVTKVADNIKGVHAKRQLVIIDEATAVGEAIFDAATNMWHYPSEFIMVVIGNPRSRLDQLGQFCEPVNGWTSVNVETEEWETKPKLNGVPGVVIRFDAEKSPNIIEGKLVSRHLPTKEKVEARRKALGGENDPLYWSNDRGFWPPEGIVKTVFTESMLIQHDGYGQFLFTGRMFTVIGAFDPAYGGDRAALRFAKLGEIEGGKMAIQLCPPIIIPVDVNKPTPVSYQLVEGVRQACDNVTVNGAKYRCAPENLGIDDTGPGGVGDIMQREWSAKIIRIEFGGRASDDPVSPEEIRPASAVYRNKRAEMHFRARVALQHDQLKGVDKETAIELCSVYYDDSKTLTTLEKKSDYKQRTGSSPDFADCGVMLMEVARLRGFRIVPKGETVHRSDEWDKAVSDSQAVYGAVSYEEEELVYDE